ncbi:hypothetical protein D9757_000939 [Collybiopsis confluens]|uniref:Uncharacterized protein n=1 Tax=Collybiopsis confluens TaxID=2823264 RepID=A0A8H5MFK6_9AGAR|nr:hypothetical protein D9757_000939 [Collybiopsis confluens]
MEWTSIPAYKTFPNRGRVANRYFVGVTSGILRLACRDPDWLLDNDFPQNLNTHIAVDVSMAAVLRTKIRNQAAKLLGPFIRDKLAKEEERESKNWPGKPNDMISWLIDEAKGQSRSVHEPIASILAVDAAAIIS